MTAHWMPDRTLGSPPGSPEPLLTVTPRSSRVFQAVAGGGQLRAQPGLDDLDVVVEEDALGIDVEAQPGDAVQLAGPGDLAVDDAVAAVGPGMAVWACSSASSTQSRHWSPMAWTAVCSPWAWA